mgnify:FL=1
MLRQNPPSPQGWIEGKLTPAFNGPIGVRSATKSDRNFIVNSWLKSFRKTSNQRANGYYANRGPIVVDLVERCASTLFVDPEENTTIWAWCVWEVLADALIVHYVYVRHLFRRNGIAWRLLRTIEADNGLVEYHTHETPVGAMIASKLKSTHMPIRWANTWKAAEERAK